MHPLEKHIRNVPDFPKQGIMFKDIMPLMRDHFPALITALGEGVDWSKVDVVIGIESRGFILGAALALQHGKGFVPIRKKGKLPPPVHAESYALEYGTDTLEMGYNDRPLRALLLDDVLATGGTLRAAMALCERNHYSVTSMNVFINLSFLNKFKEEGLPLHAVINY